MVDQIVQMIGLLPKNLQLEILDQLKKIVEEE